MASNLVWCIINENNKGYYQGVLLDSDLNIQYSNNFVAINNDSSVNNSIVDNYNNLIFVCLNYSQSLLDIFKISYQDTEHYTIPLSSDTLSYFKSIYINIALNILSNNNILISIVTAANIYYYIIDENFNITSGTTPYTGLLSGTTPSSNSNVVTANNRIIIGNTIYDNNFNIINPKILPSNIATGNINCYMTTSFLKNYGLIESNVNGKGIIYLIDLNGNIISSINMPNIVGGSFFCYNTSNYPTLTNYVEGISSYPISYVYFYQLNFNTQSYAILNTIAKNENPLYLNYDSNIIYFWNYTNSNYTLEAVDFNTATLINSIPYTYYNNNVFLSNNQILEFSNTINGQFNLYDKNLNLIKSKILYPNYDSNNGYVYLLSSVTPLPNYQGNTQKNMTVIYNPLLCKMYTANEVLELS
jgi:hypothetical protein